MFLRRVIIVTMVIGKHAIAPAMYWKSCRE